MSDEEKKEPTLPLILKQNRLDSEIQPLRYQFGKDTYQVYKNTKSPFSGRSLDDRPPQPKVPLESAMRLVRHLSSTQCYTVHTGSEAPAHSKRKSISHTPQKGKSPKKEFILPERLKENKQKLESFIQIFFQDALSRLHDSPLNLAYIVNELVLLFQAHGIKIKVYDAYKQFQHWPQFLEALDLISQDSEVENFEHFCSALIGFYSQHQ